MQSFESPSSPQNEFVEQEDPKELSQNEKELIRDIMTAEKGHAMSLPGGDVLFAVPGPHGKQLEWTADRDGRHRGELTVRSQFDKRIVLESEDGVHWTNAEGQSWDMGGTGVPAAVFDDIKPFYSLNDE